MGARKYRGQPLRGKRKTRKRRKRVKRSTMILLTIMVGYFVFRFTSLKMQYNDKVSQRDALQVKINQAAEYQEQLSEQIEQSDSKEYIESLARKYFGLVYPGEKVYIEKEGGNTDTKE